MAATSRSRSWRSSGSPPVSRTVVMPSRVTPIRISRRISSSVSTSARRQPVQTLGRHAVRAAQVAAVGQRHPQIGGHPPVASVSAHAVGSAEPTSASHRGRAGAALPESGAASLHAASRRRASALRARAAPTSSARNLGAPAERDDPVGMGVDVHRLAADETDQGESGLRGQLDGQRAGRRHRRPGRRSRPARPSG